MSSQPSIRDVSSRFDLPTLSLRADDSSSQRAPHGRQSGGRVKLILILIGLVLLAIGLVVYFSFGSPVKVFPDDTDLESDETSSESPGSETIKPGAETDTTPPGQGSDTTQQGSESTEPGPETSPAPPSIPISRPFNNLQDFYSGKLGTECGLRSAEWTAPNPSLVTADYYSRNVDKYHQPWYLEIFTKSTVSDPASHSKEAVYQCSAVLVAADWVLTSDECAINLKDVTKQFWVVGGVRTRKEGSLAVYNVAYHKTIDSLVREINIKAGIEHSPDVLLIMLKLKQSFSVPLKVLQAGNDQDQILVNNLCLPPPPLSDAVKSLKLVSDKDHHYEMVGLLTEDRQKVEANQLIELRIQPVATNVNYCDSVIYGKGSVPAGKLLVCGGGGLAVCRYTQPGASLFRLGNLVGESKLYARFY